MATSVARQLAKYLVETHWEKLPDDVLDRSKLAITDTIASALAGDGKETANLVRRLVLEVGGKGEATLWGKGRGKVPAPNAARANAVLADAMAFDESHMSTMAHVCGVTVPSAIAVGERTSANGRELITAIALGYEAAGRIGRSVTPAYWYEHGFHNSVITIFGAAVAAGKLLGLSTMAMTHAITLAATSASGLVGSRNSYAREYHGGNSAMMGVNAALAAAHGYTGLETALEGPEGYCDAFGIRARPEAITEALGDRWEMVTDFAPKLMPGSHGIHTVVEATLGALKAGQVKPENITRITVKGPRWKQEYAVYHPQDLANGSHSIPYFVARASLAGSVTWDDLSLGRLQDHSTWDLQEKVEIVEDEAQKPYDYPGGAKVTIAVRDGQSFTYTVEHALGTPGRGFSWEQIQGKYQELAPRGGLSPRQLADGLELLRRLETVSNVQDVVQYLVAK